MTRVEQIFIGQIGAFYKRENHWPTYKEMADATGRKVSTVRRIVYDLEKQGAVWKFGLPGKPIYFQLRGGLP